MSATTSPPASPAWLQAAATVDELLSTDQIPLRSDKPTPVPDDAAKKSEAPKKQEPVEKLQTPEPKPVPVVNRLAKELPAELPKKPELVEKAPPSDPKPTLVTNRIAKDLPAQPTKTAVAARLPKPDPVSAIDGEIDVHWGGYAGRDLVPSTVFCAALAAGWVLYLVPLLPAGWHWAELVYGLPGALVAFQLVRWGYRTAAFHYRVTNRRLFHHRGRLYGRAGAVDLASVATVRVQQHLVDWLLGIGRVRLTFDRDSQPPVVLEGVAQPKRLAAVIERTMRQARAGTVTAARVERPR